MKRLSADMEPNCEKMEICEALFKNRARHNHKAHQNGEIVATNTTTYTGMAERGFL